MNIRPIVDRLDMLLTPLGFVRKKLLWNRRKEPFIDVLDLQVSKAGDAVTVNVGVLHSLTHAICWGEKPSGFIQEPTCTVRARIGQLFGQNDVWWTDIDAHAVEQIVEKVRNFALPLFEKLHSVEALEMSLSKADEVKQKYPPPIIFLAILKAERGNVAAAQTILEELALGTVPTWKKKISDVVSRLKAGVGT